VFGKLLDGSGVTEADSNEVTECCPCNDDSTTTTDVFGNVHVCLSVCVSVCLSVCLMSWDQRSVSQLRLSACSLLLVLLWQSPLGVYSAKRRHQSPQWTTLSHIDYFIQGEIVLLAVDSLHPRSTRAPWWSPPVHHRGSCSQMILIFDILFDCFIYTPRPPKKEATKLLAITFSNLNQFSKFFHCWIEDGGKYYAVLLEIFILFSAVKEFWKSVKIWDIYCQKVGRWLPFCDTVYIC